VVTNKKKTCILDFNYILKYFKAARNDDVSSVKKALTEHPNLSAKDYEGKTALILGLKLKYNMIYSMNK
jgi:hypothetical protein